MKKLTITQKAVIPAEPKVVYGVLADYKNGHPPILPGYFSPLEIEQGGTGAGTVIRFSMTSMGTTRHFHQEVSEPVPGQVLMEKDLDSDTVTTFTVLPAEGEDSTVEISTTMAVRDGIAGWLEGMMAKSFLRTVYRKELNNLKQYMMKMSK